MEIKNVTYHHIAKSFPSNTNILSNVLTSVPVALEDDSYMLLHH